MDELWVGKVVWEGATYALLLEAPGPFLPGRSVRARGLALQPLARLPTPRKASLSLSIDHGGSVSVYCEGLPNPPTAAWFGSWDARSQSLWASLRGPDRKGSALPPRGQLTLSHLRTKQALDAAMPKPSSFARVFPPHLTTAWRGHLTQSTAAPVGPSQAAAGPNHSVVPVEASLSFGLVQLAVGDSGGPIWFGTLAGTAPAAPEQPSDPGEPPHPAAGPGSGRFWGFLPLTQAGPGGRTRVLDPWLAEDTIVWGSFFFEGTQLTGHLQVNKGVVRCISMIGASGESPVGLVLRPGLWERPLLGPARSNATAELAATGLPSPRALDRSLSQPLRDPAAEHSRVLAAGHPRPFYDSACPFIPVVMREGERRKLAPDIWELGRAEDLRREVVESNLSAGDRAQLEHADFLKKCSHHHSVSVFTLPLWIVCPPELRGITAATLDTGPAAYPYYKPSQLRFSLPRRKCFGWDHQTGGRRGLQNPAQFPSSIQPGHQKNLPLPPPATMQWWPQPVPDPQQQSQRSQQHHVHHRHHHHRHHQQQQQQQQQAMPVPGQLPQRTRLPRRQSVPGI